VPPCTLPRFAQNHRHAIWTTIRRSKAKVVVVVVVVVVADAAAAVDVAVLAS
jgi:hypothetical protein